MARTKRRVPARRARDSRKADWVYRDNIHDEEGSLLEDNGTWVPDFPQPLVPGFASAYVLSLYDSFNYMKQLVTVGSNIPTSWGRYGRAEGKNARILRVQGSIAVTPSIWTLGSSYFFAARFGIWQQSAFNGAAFVEASYNYWGGGSALIATRSSRYANMKNWQHERSYIERFNDSNFTRNLYFNFPVNRTLKPDESYGVYVETADGSANLTLNMRLRTLVQDDD